MQDLPTSSMDKALQLLRDAGMPANKEPDAREWIDRAVQNATSPIFQKKAPAKQVRRQLAAFTSAADKLDKAFSQLGPEARGAIYSALPRPQWLDYEPRYHSAEEAFQLEVLPWAAAASRSAKQKRLPGYGADAGKLTRESWAFEFIFQLIGVFEWATGRTATQFYNDKRGRRDSAFRRFVDAAAPLLPVEHRNRVTFTTIIDAAINVRKRTS